MEVDSRLVLQYPDGQMTFRHLCRSASYSQMFALAKGLNLFQDVPVERVLLVTVTQF